MGGARGRGLNERAQRWERRFEFPILGAALLVIPVVVIQAQGRGGGWGTLANVLNWVVWAAFAIELVVMLAVVPDRMHWVRKHPLEVVIVVLTPPFLPASFAALRVFRLLRLLRIVVIVGEAKRFLTIDGVRLAAVLAAMSALAGGALFANAEHHSSWDGFYWAVTTMATVGYGDLSPHTVVGRVDAMVLMVVGISFFALITGAIAQHFVHTDVKAVEKAIEHQESDTRAQVLAELQELSTRLQRLESVVRDL
jgi:voltage-gated potassium channel